MKRGGLAMLLERAGCLIFYSKVISNFLNNLWWISSCEVGNECIYNEYKWSASAQRQRNECLSVGIKMYIFVYKAFIKAVAGKVLR